MARRGTATLPLHDGRAPSWLFERMETLGGAIAEAVIEEYGPAELLTRLADPYWFQSLGCVIGFDWHSSGLTTTTMGALKEALEPQEYGIAIAGGKGRTSRRAPDEIADAADVLSLGGRRGEWLADASRMSAAVDNGCVQDDYTLYHHTFVVSEAGDWCVVQQGMTDADGTARRYHWLSDSLSSYVECPHAAICAMDRRNGVLDLTAEASAETRSASVDLACEDPQRLKRYARSPNQRSLGDFAGDPQVDLAMPDRHELRLADLTERSIDQLHVAYEHQPDDYEELVGLSGIGRGSLRALSLVAEVVHGTESSRTDPAKYAYAHGGKDGTPYPVDRERYDRSIEFLQATLEGAEVGRSEKRAAMERLADLDERVADDAEPARAD